MEIISFINFLSFGKKIFQNVSKRGTDDFREVLHISVIIDAICFNDFWVNKVQHFCSELRCLSKLIYKRP